MKDAVFMTSKYKLSDKTPEAFNAIKAELSEDRMKELVCLLFHYLDGDIEISTEGAYHAYLPAKPVEVPFKSRIVTSWYIKKWLWREKIKDWKSFFNSNQSTIFTTTKVLWAVVSLVLAAALGAYFS